MYKISVIVPVYNAEKYIQKCIDSILTQTLKEIEIILVNDGSVDKSPEILDEYAKKNENIKVIHQQNSGPSKARNIGIENANGEYIGFLDADDYISDDMYETLYNIADKNNVDIVISDYYNVTNDNATHQGNFDIPKNQVINKEQINKILTNANELRILWFGGKSIYKANIIRDNNIFYPPFKLGEETVFVLDFILSANSMYYINKPFYYYVQTPNSLTRIKYKEELLHQLELLYFAKKQAYTKHCFNSFKNDLNQYTMKHTIPMLISNQLNANSNIAQKIKDYKKIRNSEMVKEAYKACSIKSINSKLKYLALLLKLRLYILLALL